MLVKLFEEKGGGELLLPLADQLWRSYLKGEQPKRAGIVLDLLAQSLTVVDLPNDSLRLRYLAADPQGGSDYFDRTAKARRPPVLVASSERGELTGIYRDLRTGEAWNLDSLRGRLVLLDFWTTWCYYCLEDIGLLKHLVEQFGGKVTLISVCSDALTRTADLSSAGKFVRDHSITYMALWDDSTRSITERFDVSKLGYPRKFLIDSSGRLLVHPREIGRKYVTLEEVTAYLSMLH